MADGAIGEGHVDKPAICAEAVAQAGFDLDNLAGEETGSVEQVAAMRLHVVALKIGFRVDRRLLRIRAFDHQGLNGIGDGVSMGRIAIPGLQRQHFAHLVVDERLGALQAGIEALHIADLQVFAGLADD